MLRNVVSTQVLRIDAFLSENLYELLFGVFFVRKLWFTEHVFFFFIEVVTILSSFYQSIWFKFILPGQKIFYSVYLETFKTLNHICARRSYWDKYLILLNQVTDLCLLRAVANKKLGGVKYV